MTLPERVGLRSKDAPGMKSALIIVADPAVRLRLLRILGRHGWWVDAVESVECALPFLDKAPRDVALIDWQIGSGSGISLLMAMKLHPTWQSIPMVMMHGGATLAEIERACEVGANDFLTHPFTGDAALRKLDLWVLDKAGLAERERWAARIFT